VDLEDLPLPDQRGVRAVADVAAATDRRVVERDVPSPSLTPLPGLDTANRGGSYEQRPGRCFRPGKRSTTCVGRNSDACAVWRAP
jgi:hypothetical protein